MIHGTGNRKRDVVASDEVQRPREDNQTMMNRVFPAQQAPPKNGTSLQADATHAQTNDDGSSWQDVFRDPSAMMGRHPVITVGIGLCAGIAIGWWVKRR